MSQVTNGGLLAKNDGL